MNKRIKRLSVLACLICIGSMLSANDKIVEAHESIQPILPAVNEDGTYQGGMPGNFLDGGSVWYFSREHPTDRVYVLLDNCSFEVLFISDDKDEVILTQEQPELPGTPITDDMLPDCVEYKGKVYKVVGLRNANLSGRDVRLPAYLRFMDGDVFRNVRTIDFNDTFETLGTGALNYTWNLKELKFPGSLTYILPDAINADTQDGFGFYPLETIEFPAGTNAIYHDNFNDFTHLSAVSLPARLEHLEENCFNGRTHLKSGKIGKYIYDMKDCFNDCPEIEEITIETRPTLNVENCFNSVDKGKCVLRVPRIRNSDGTSPFMSGFWQGFKIVEVDSSGVQSVIQEAGTVNPALYNLSGMPISSPDALHKGEIYIEKAAGKTEKKMAD